MTKIQPKPLPPIPRLREMIAYDPATGEMKWASTGKTRGSGRRRIVGATATTLGSNGYYRVFVDGQNYAAHRVAWAMVYGAEPAAQVDHIDGCPTNNAIRNLRSASQVENQRNSRRHIDHPYPKGVGCHPKGRVKPYQARIFVEGKMLHLGMFGSAEEASAAYCRAAVAYFGEFANDGTGPIDGLRQSVGLPRREDSSVD